MCGRDFDSIDNDTPKGTNLDSEVIDGIFPGLLVA